MKKMRNIVVFVALVCGLVMAPNSGYSQKIDQADIYITPATELDFFSGYFGGDGDFSNIDEWIDWSIGQSAFQCYENRCPGIFNL